MYNCEADLARAVVAWLKSMHWEVYQEVMLDICTQRPDIVAVQKNVLWVIECKMHFGAQVLAQAKGHMGHANFISTATPDFKRDSVHRYLLESAEHNGIGVMVPELRYKANMVECVRPKLFRKRSKYIESSLNPAQKDFAEAGTSGTYWTPFKETSKTIQKYVAEHPGCTLKMIIDNCPTHWRTTGTARSMIPHWVREGVIEGIRISRDGRNMKFYPKLGAWK